MTIDLDYLETTAKAATPGPWYASGAPKAYCIASRNDNTDIVSVNLYNEYIKSGVQREEDADFIAAANPAVVLELIAELRSARLSAVL